ncbi:hypothetical protein COY52_12045 [Candidatus Desantisbacteria bacterium CG_4_10_14_0_8_um_filter_48_22]|uniref:peptidoglycan glycosyltransferase n=1 Tax=Candidatus Desantisbacteria bacterium CG_4_10_14_0_8_um_filter_48_22 TaxID=1974543 RepID=A0A2M7S4S8_9BACT|nr:MAG: hypothetical protein COY52_12045 [Candidatus Desantisbacteria bacterium CG_4_10_14_0_8_um_filter_48_22]
MIKKIGRAKKIFIFSSCLIIAGAAVSAWLWTFIPFPGELLNLRSKISLRILDRNGILLREVLSDDSGKGQWVGLDRIPAHMINASVAAEDARFYSHAGIDFLATIRAVMQNASKRRIVSGGSTITQQVMRNIFHFPRDLPHKALEALYAIRLERSLKKEEIVAQYLNLAPYGNQVYGIEAASRLYFQKPAFYLSLAECCFLAAIPKSPVEFNPYSNFKRTKNRQREILSRMYEKGFVDRDSFKRAIKERVNIVPPEKCFRAPHFCEWVLSQLSAEQKQGIKTIVTSLDYYIQKEVEGFTAQQIKTLKDQGVTNGAVTVIDNRTGEIIAMVGSADFFSRFIGGQVNGVLALRQPGSTLKPFTYGLALESGMTPASIIPDIPTFLQTANGKFAPENYDKKYHGPVRMRTALSCSYNVPAVRTADRIGINALLEKIKGRRIQKLK